MGVHLAAIFTQPATRAANETSGMTGFSVSALDLETLAFDTRVSPERSLVFAVEHVPAASVQTERCLLQFSSLSHA
jgi:hypothetical protein